MVVCENDKDTKPQHMERALSAEVEALIESEQHWAQVLTAALMWQLHLRDYLQDSQDSEQPDSSRPQGRKTYFHHVMCIWKSYLQQEKCLLMQM